MPKLKGPIKWLRVDNTFYDYCEALAEAIKKSESSQRDVAITTGVDQTTISRVVTRYYRSTRAVIISQELFDRIAKLAVLFDVKPPELKPGNLKRAVGMRRKVPIGAPAPKAPEAPAQEPATTTDPRLLVLNLLAQQKITPENALALLSSLK